MKRFLLFAGTLVASLMAEVKNDSTAEILNSLKWKNRVLVIYEPDVGGEDGRKRAAVLKKAAPGLQERDLVILVMDEEARRRHQVAPEQFVVLLFGKDGGLKARQEKDLNLEALFRLIDAMPMRRQEIREAHPSK